MLNITFGKYFLYTINLFVVAAFCNLLFNILQSLSSISMHDSYNRKPFWGYVVLLALVYITQHIITYVFFASKTLYKKQLIRIIVSFVFIWVILNLYRTPDIHSLKNPSLNSGNISLIFGSILIPFSEALLILLKTKTFRPND